MAGAEGISSGPNLGQIDNAERDLRTADELVQAVLKSRPSNRPAMLKAAEIASYRMLGVWERGRENEASVFAHKSQEWLDRFQAGAGDKANGAAIVRTYAFLAHQYMMEQDLDEAIRLSRRGEDLARVYQRTSQRPAFLDTIALALTYQGTSTKPSNRFANR